MHNVIVDVANGSNGQPIGWVSLDADDANAVKLVADVASGNLDMDESGWSKPCQIPLVPTGHTIYDVLIQQCDHPDHKDKLASIKAAHQARMTNAAKPTNRNNAG